MTRDAALGQSRQTAAAIADHLEYVALRNVFGNTVICCHLLYSSLDFCSVSLTQHIFYLSNAMIMVR
jgi:hypothetical protein